MKKLYLVFFCAASLLLFSACSKEKKETTGNDKVDEIVEKAFKDMTGKEQFASVLKDAYKLSLEDVEPWADAPEKNEKGGDLFMGVDNINHNVTALFTKKDGSAIDKEEYKAYVKKMYELSKSRLAQDGKNVKGFMFANTLEKALEEKTFESLWESEFWPQQWNFRMNDEFYDFTIELNADKTPQNIKFSIAKTLQKSLDDSLKDAEKALENEDVQKAIKDALKN